MIAKGLSLVSALPLIGLVAPAARSQQGTVVEWPRIEISVSARRLWVVTQSGDTLRSAPVAVGRGDTLSADGRTWIFRTPIGATHVTAKEVAPEWVPPDWHYLERAREQGLKLARLPVDTGAALADGTRLVVRGRLIGRVGADSAFAELPASHELVFDGTVFIPPLGSRNRSVPSVLGPYRLVLANGLGLHGTQDVASIGRAASHGCVRLHDADITWLYDHIAIGTRVIVRG